MPHPTPYPRCIFCHEKADSKEHAIPKWMSKRLGIDERLIGKGNVQAPRERISFKSFRAKIFCGSCNAHFKHLEDAAIPLIEPMAKGWPISLGVTSQKTVAQWGAKTAMALLAASAPDVAKVIPNEHRRAVRYAGHPPGALWVGYLPWAGTQPHIWVGDGHIHVVKESEPDKVIDSLHTYSILFCFRELALNAVGLIDSIPADAELTNELPSMPRFWPPRFLIQDWPPPEQPFGATEDLPRLTSFNPLRQRR